MSGSATRFIAATAIVLNLLGLSRENVDSVVAFSLALFLISEKPEAMMALTHLLRDNSQLQDTDDLYREMGEDLDAMMSKYMHSEISGRSIGEEPCGQRCQHCQSPSGRPVSGNWKCHDCGIYQTDQPRRS